MRLKNEKPSSNVEHAVHGNREGKGSNLIYKNKVFKEALKDISTQFQDSIRGKGDRQNGPDSPMTKFIKKKTKP